MPSILEEKYLINSTETEFELAQTKLRKKNEEKEIGNTE